MYSSPVENAIQVLEEKVRRLQRENRELAASHTRLRAILDTEPECVKLLSAEGLLLDMNAAGLRMLEAESLEHVRNHCVYPLIAAEHRDAFVALNATIMAGGSGMLEFEIVGLKGTRRWLETHASPLRDATGAPSAVLGFTRDITERKRAAAELHRSEEILRLFVDHSPAAIAMFDRGMNYVTCSRRFLTDFGLVGQDIAGRCHYAVFPEIPERWKDVHRRCLAGASEKNDADRFERADGSEDWVRWEIHPWREAGGEIGGIILFSEKITERVQAQQRLQEAALRQQAMARRLAEVRETEQRVLSAELHDRIGQNLTALGFNLHIIGNGARFATEAVATRLHDSVKLLESTIASVRGLISDMRPPVLDSFGLLAGLRWLAQQVHERTGLQISVCGDEPEAPVNRQVQGALFRIAQEALTNIVKHADARRADLLLGHQHGKLNLRIADDGRGFDVADKQRPGPRTYWGLEMMNDRAEAVGARLRVESIPGKGTWVVVELAPDSGCESN